MHDFPLIPILAGANLGSKKVDHGKDVAVIVGIGIEPYYNLTIDYLTALLEFACRVEVVCRAERKHAVKAGLVFLDQSGYCELVDAESVHLVAGKLVSV